MIIASNIKTQRFTMSVHNTIQSHVNITLWSLKIYQKCKYVESFSFIIFSFEYQDILDIFK